MKVKAGELPLRAFEDTSSFKLYSSDVGLLVQQAGIPKELILKDLPNLYLGAVTENYVAQSVRAQGNDLFYWTSDQTAELDFLLQCGMDIIPIEVKKGTKVRSRSLDVYRKKYDVTKAIRFSERNFGLEGQLISLPLYAAFALEDSLGIA
jgi:predicted AAA+ superfamily ATPase